MRTISSQDAKGQEPPRTLRDDLALLRHILRVAYAYFIKGRPIRRKFLQCQKLGEKLYIEEIRLP